MVPSRGRSRNPIRTSDPIIMMTPLTSPTIAEDAASRSRSVSEVTRVTSSPAGRLMISPTWAPINRRTMPARASSTIRSARVPIRIHCQRARIDPATSIPRRRRMGRRMPDSSFSPSRTHLVTIGPARLAAEIRSPSTRPSAIVGRCGRENDQSMRQRAAWSLTIGLPVCQLRTSSLVLGSCPLMKSRCVWCRAQRAGEVVVACPLPVMAQELLPG